MGGSFLSLDMGWHGTGPREFREPQEFFQSYLRVRGLAGPHPRKED